MVTKFTNHILQVLLLSVLVGIFSQPIRAAVMVKDSSNVFQSADFRKTGELRSKKKFRERKRIFRKSLRKKIGFFKRWFKKSGKTNTFDPTVKNDYRKTNVFSLLSFVFLFSFLLISLGPLYSILVFALYILSPVFAIIGLTQIREKPYLYKGAWMSWFTLVVYLLALLFLAIAIVAFWVIIL